MYVGYRNKLQLINLNDAFIYLFYKRHTYRFKNI